VQLSTKSEAGNAQGSFSPAPGLNFSENTEKLPTRGRVLNAQPDTLSHDGPLCYQSCYQVARIVAFRSFSRCARQFA
jgi:hypothetical protein